MCQCNKAIIVFDLILQLFKTHRVPNFSGDCGRTDRRESEELRSVHGDAEKASQSKGPVSENSRQQTRTGDQR